VINSSIQVEAHSHLGLKLDWNCRCSATELDHEAEATPVQELADLPEAAEGFRENVGKTGQIFGADHPYFQMSALEARKIEAQL